MDNIKTIIISGTIAGIIGTTVGVSLPEKDVTITTKQHEELEQAFEKASRINAKRVIDERGEIIVNSIGESKEILSVKINGVEYIKK